MSLLYANEAAGAWPRSWYVDTAPPPAAHAPLGGAVRADVCVIGGGYTGLSAALAARAKGRSVVLIDAHRVGFGASGRNGGQVGTGQRWSQGALEDRFGMQAARALWELAEAAKAEVRGLALRHGIDADWRDGLLYAARTAKGAETGRRDAEHLARAYGYDAIEVLDRGAVSDALGTDAFAGGTLDRGAGHIHPLRFAFGLARAAAAAGVRIFEGTEATKVVPGRPATVETPAGRVTAEAVVLATNGYGPDLVADVARRVMPINNFIVATEPLAEPPVKGGIAAADDRFVVNYWRMSPDGRLLFGGAESYGDRFPDIERAVRPHLARIYPALAKVPFTHAWGGTLAITRSRLPYLAQPAPGVWSAGGYSGHGVGLATLAGRLIAEAIAGDVGGFRTMAQLDVPPFPGGAAARRPLLALAMRWFALRDRLGV